MAGSTPTGFRDSLIEKASRLVIREVLTTTMDPEPGPAALWSCCLTRGEVTQVIDPSFFEPGAEYLLSVHHRLIDFPVEPIVCCLESLLQLAGIVDGDPERDGD